MDEKKVVKVGIDFGTTNCFVAFVHGDDVRSLVPSKERFGIPSVFYYDGQRILVGQIAADRAKRHPENAVFSIKRKLRQTSVRAGGKDFKPKEIITNIISYIMECAEMMLAQQYMVEYDAVEAVVTVPVDFLNPEIQLIRQAAKEVKLKSGKPFYVTKMLPEPCAAAIEYFGMTGQEDSDILVYDLGGGTFDAALVHANQTGEPYEVIDQVGNSALGGDDWDEKLGEWLLKQYERAYGITANEVMRRDFIREARVWKHELTDLQETEASVQVKGDIFDQNISRQQFEQMTSSLLRKTEDAIDELVRRQPSRRIGKVILTGGSTYMPQVLAMLRRKFPSTVDVRQVEPENAIAFGAARYADSIRWAEAEQQKMIDLIAPHSYGIIYWDEARKRRMINILIRKGDKLPAEVQKHSCTQQDNMTTSNYRVCETDVCDDRKWIELDEGKEIMLVELTRKTAVPKGTKAVQHLSLGEDMVLRLRAEDNVNGVSQENELKIEMKMG